MRLTMSALVTQNKPIRPNTILYARKRERERGMRI